MSPLAFPLLARPIRGESALGFASRLADVNGFPLHGVLRDVGDLRRHDGWEDRHWDRLAARAGVPVETLGTMRQRPAGIATAPAAVHMLGKAVHPHYLVTDRLRICPTCVGERRILKEVWRLMHCVACVDHGCALVDTCDCGRHFDLKSRGDDPFACVCGRPFADNHAEPAGADAALGAEWLVQAFGAGQNAIHPRLWLVKGGRLPLPFSAMEPYDVMLVMDLVGRAATTPPEEDAPVTPGRRYNKGAVRGRDLATSSAQVTAAVGVLGAWPHAYRALLANVAGRNAEAGSTRPRDLFATSVGQTMLAPYLGLDGQPLGPLQQEVDEFLGAQGHRVRQKVPIRVSATARDVHAAMSCSRVAEALGLRPSNAMLKRVYRETVAAFDQRRDDFDAPGRLASAVLKEVRRRLAVADDWMSPSAASEHLCHPSVATQSAIWMQPELLVPVEPDRSVAPLIKGRAFLRVDVERMRRRIANAAALVAPDAVPVGYEPYAVASKTGVDVVYTGKDLLLDLLSGTVPSVRTIEEPRLTDLFVHTATARLRSLERRVARILERDQFAGTSRCEEVLGTLWPDRGETLTIEVNRALRAAGGVRFETRLNTTEGRTRPLYWYSIADHMLRTARLVGASVSPTVDRLMAEMLRTGRVGIRQDAETG